MLAPARLLPPVLALVLAVWGLAPAPAAPANDPEYARQWGLEVIGAEAAWNAGLMGRGIDIAIVDTGVHLTHQDLRANMAPGVNLVTAGANPQDDQSHGTHVAGIAAAGIDNGGIVGVAPKARIMPVKVLTSSGQGNSDTVAAGIRWAADNGAEVINLSLGEDVQAVFGPSTEAAVEYAWSKGSICVFAAGNDYILSSGFATQPALVVASTSRNDRISDFSNGVGQAQWGLSAPGGADSSIFSPEADDIFSTVWVSDSRTDTYSYKAGTSMAAPHVAGAAALLRGAGLTPAQTVDRLLATAKDLGRTGRDNTYGHGRLDVAKAVQGLSAGGGQGAGGGGSGGGGAGGGGGTATAPPAATAPPTTAAARPPESSRTPTARRPAGAPAAPSAAEAGATTTDNPPAESPAPEEAAAGPPGEVVVVPAAPPVLEPGAETDSGKGSSPGWIILAGVLVAGTGGGALAARRRLTSPG